MNYRIPFLLAICLGKAMLLLIKVQSLSSKKKKKIVLFIISMFIHTVGLLATSAQVTGDKIKPSYFSEESLSTHIHLLKV